MRLRRAVRARFKSAPALIFVADGIMINVFVCCANLLARGRVGLRMLGPTGLRSPLGAPWRRRACKWCGAADKKPI